MTTLRIHIEIKIGGEWFRLTPIECVLLGFPCPKYPSSVFDTNTWDFTMLDNHFFIAVITGEKNPNNLISTLSKTEYCDTFQTQSATEEVQERLLVADKLGKTISHLVCVRQSLFLDVGYWNSELYNGSMRLKYRDLIEDYDVWYALSEKLTEEFDDFRFIFWLEE